MSEMMSIFMLLSVPLLPLILAIPALRCYLSRPAYIALLPAIVMLLVAEPVAIELPWLLLGITLGVDAMSRLLLAMLVVLWAASATLLHESAQYSSGSRFTTYFLLTMAGSLGTVAAADVVSFFSFLTLTGYGLYALLVSQGDDTRQVGRIYLSFMILADLVLLEALLIAAAATDDLRFEAVRHAMLQSSSADLYLSMVFIGFAARAGVWPLHFWLPLVFRSSRPVVAVLLGGIPITVGLLGLVRWLPLGEIVSPGLGMIIQSLGIIAIVYAILAGLIQAQLKMLPVYAALVISGIYAAAIGIGLANPVVWKQYENLVHFFIAYFGMGFALLVIVTWWSASKYDYALTAVPQPDYLSRWFKQSWPAAIRRSIEKMKFDSLYRWCTKVGFLWQKHSWQRIWDYSERSLQHWNIAITLFLLLGIVVVLVGVLSSLE